MVPAQAASTTPSSPRIQEIEDFPQANEKGRRGKTLTSDVVSAPSYAKLPVRAKHKTLERVDPGQFNAVVCKNYLEGVNEWLATKFIEFLSGIPSGSKPVDGTLDELITSIVKEVTRRRDDGLIPKGVHGFIQCDSRAVSAPLAIGIRAL